MLLDSSQFSEKLFDAISDCKESFVACSAFIKVRALEHAGFADNLACNSVVVVARWQKHDLLMGASDLEVYELCKAKGWKFGIDLNLHGKLFLIDESKIFLGSANLTQRGLHIGLVGNHEFGTEISAVQADVEKVKDFIESEVTWMNDDLYALILKEFLAAKEEKVPILSSSWSQAIYQMVRKPVEYLWVQELVFSTPYDLLRLNLSDDRAVHDFELLGLNIDDVSEAALKRSFKRLKLFEWICSILATESLSFGGVSTRLHSSILDDPKPYRVDVKNYNRILFEWAEFVDDIFEVSRPNYAQVLRLKSNL